MCPWNAQQRLWGWQATEGTDFTVPVSLFFTMPYFFNELYKCLPVREQSRDPAAPSSGLGVPHHFRASLTLCILQESFLGGMVASLLLSSNSAKLGGTADSLTFFVT